LALHVKRYDTPGLHSEMEELGLLLVAHFIILLLAKWTTWEENNALQGGKAGGPLSPMLFILAMEPLHRMFKKAQDLNLLSKVSNYCNAFRASLYADDAIVFIKPTTEDLQVTLCILQTFAHASGLTTNLDKTQNFPIQCSETNMDFLS
jgi:hypothetical protein